MSTTIVRGGSCRIVFRPLNGVRVADLGTPSIGISQELTFLTPNVTLDVTNNRIYADLTEEDTMQLVENVETRAQAAFTNDSTEVVYRFPEHYITVVATVFDSFYSEHYARVTPSSGVNPSEQDWYELINGVYEPTEDQGVVSGKAYYAAV